MAWLLAARCPRGGRCSRAAAGVLRCWWGGVDGLKEGSGSGGGGNNRCATALSGWRQPKRKVCWGRSLCSARIVVGPLTGALIHWLALRARGRNGWWGGAATLTLLSRWVQAAYSLACAAHSRPRANVGGGLTRRLNHNPPVGRVTRDVSVNGGNRWWNWVGFWLVFITTNTIGQMLLLNYPSSDCISWLISFLSLTIIRFIAPWNNHNRNKIRKKVQRQLHISVFPGTGSPLPLHPPMCVIPPYFSCGPSLEIWWCDTGIQLIG